MSTLAVQVASATRRYRGSVDQEGLESEVSISVAVLHCYAVDAEFDPNTPALLHDLQGVRDAQLVTRGRETSCLVLYIERRTRASALVAIVDEAMELLGFDDVEMRAPLTSLNAGQRVDEVVDWLTYP
jgi:hypothetical protein